MKTDLPESQSDLDRTNDFNLDRSGSKTYKNRRASNKKNATYLTLGLATLAAIVAGSYALRNRNLGVAQSSQPLIATPTNSTSIGKLTNFRQGKSLTLFVQTAAMPVLEQSRSQ